MSKPTLDEGRAFAERHCEIRLNLMLLYGELPFHFPNSPDWVRITREIEDETKNLKAVSEDWAAYERGVA